VSIDGLFAEPEHATGPVVTARPGERRRATHLAVIATGFHPLGVALKASIPLHPDAPRDGRREPDGTPRCGTCVHRRQRNTGTASSYPKCLVHPQERTATNTSGPPYRWRSYPRATNGEGTDVAAWWPACADYELEAQS
jgi:hypothetical protein